MKKILMLLLVLVAGTGVGGGAAYATGLLLGPNKPGAKDSKADVPTSFVPVTKVIAPLVTTEGRLAGYVAIEAQLEVPAEDAASVTERMPLLLHAINMRTYRTPMAAGPDGMLPNISVFRKIVMDSAPEAFGPKVVRLVAVTQAVPA